MGVHPECGIPRVRLPPRSIMETTVIRTSKSAAAKLKMAMMKKRGTTRGVTIEVSEALEAKAKEILAEG